MTPRYYPPFNRLNGWQIEWRVRGNSDRTADPTGLRGPPPPPSSAYIPLQLEEWWGGTRVSAEGVLIDLKVVGGGVKSEQWNELIMVMPEQIDERDVCFEPPLRWRVLDPTAGPGQVWQSGIPNSNYRRWLLDWNAISAVLKLRCLGFVRIPEPNLTLYSSDRDWFRECTVPWVWW